MTFRSIPADKAHLLVGKAVYLIRSKIQEPVRLCSVDGEIATIKTRDLKLLKVSLMELRWKIKVS